MGRAAGRSRTSSPSSAGHRSARRPCATGHYRVGTRLPGAPRGLQTVLPGGQLGRGPAAGREALAGASGHLRRCPAPRLHDTGQIDAVDGHVLGGADARTVPGNPLHQLG